LNINRFIVPKMNLPDITGIIVGEKSLEDEIEDEIYLFSSAITALHNRQKTVELSRDAEITRITEEADKLIRLDDELIEMFQAQLEHAKWRLAYIKVESDIQTEPTEQVGH